jgi:hypothetical protein
VVVHLGTPSYHFGLPFDNSGELRPNGKQTAKVEPMQDLKWIEV